MEIDHLHFYVDDAIFWRDWLIRHFDFDRIPPKAWHLSGAQVLQAAAIQVVISDGVGSRVGARFLQNHPPGVGDLGFRVRDVDHWMDRINRAGGVILQPTQASLDGKRWGQIQGWGDLRHTLVEQAECRIEMAKSAAVLPWQAIDHAVLNVPQGELQPATAWYESVLGFRREQHFAISTPHSGLRSLVLKHPEGGATLPINEPTSSTSQIQEFLDHHRGAGIQHVAWGTQNLIETVAILRQRGIRFLSVPRPYYEELSRRSGFWAAASDWAEIAQQQILVDWAPDTPQARLLQTFTEPLFAQPTFFLELIERQAQGEAQQRAEGFGAGNFQALFEAIERQQRERGNL